MGWRDLVRPTSTSICQPNGVPFEVTVPDGGAAARRASPGREVCVNGSHTTHWDTALPSKMVKSIQDATTSTGVTSNE